VMATLPVATAHALILTVSHGLLFRQPRCLRRHRCRRFRLNVTSPGYQVTKFSPHRRSRPRCRNTPSCARRPVSMRA
jgi:hypothetical protein